ncbi:MAG: DUF2878 family protein [Polyangiaceae bacterium]|nr:DUF2878 family protein [Polyangiaceae bacterium]
MTIARSPLALALALIGCTALLTVGDQFHVQYGVISYPYGGPVFGQAWWVAPGFAVATVGFVGLAWPFAPFVVKPTRKTIAADAAWFFASYAASGILGHRVVGLTSLLFGLWMYRVARRSDRRAVIWFSVMLAVVGTLGEIALHATGVTSYARKDIVLVPAWLPVLYMQGAPLALSITRWIRGEMPSDRRVDDDD